MRFKLLSLLILLCSIALPPNLPAGELPARSAFVRAGLLARPRARQPSASLSQLAPDCPHPDDALWSNQFGIPDLTDAPALAEDAGDLILLVLSR